MKGWTQKQTRARVLCHSEPVFVVPKSTVSKSFLGPSSCQRFCWLMSEEVSDRSVTPFLFHVWLLSAAHTPAKPVTIFCRACEPPSANASPVCHLLLSPVAEEEEKMWVWRGKGKGGAGGTNESEAFLEEDKVHEETYSIYIKCSRSCPPLQSSVSKEFLKILRLKPINKVFSIATQGKFPFDHADFVEVDILKMQLEPIMETSRGITWVFSSMESHWPVRG